MSAPIDTLSAYKKYIYIPQYYNFILEKTILHKEYKKNAMRRCMRMCFIMHQNHFMAIFHHLMFALYPYLNDFFKHNYKLYMAS